jgi:hypothetical protein
MRHWTEIYYRQSLDPRLEAAVVTDETLAVKYCRQRRGPGREFTTTRERPRPGIHFYHPRNSDFYAYSSLLKLSSEKMTVPEVRALISFFKEKCNKNAK